MGASPAEQEWAQTNGVKIKHWAKPARLLKQGEGLKGIEFEYTRLDSKGRLTGTGEKFSLEADMVFKAIGQTFVPAVLDGSADVLEHSDGRIAVDQDRRTSLPMVWAGGDCVAGGEDLTVAGVQDGKVAALSIDRTLRA
jgi:glutamate synthase (NADPH/NADH) small chain